MNTPALWKRPDLQFPQPFDTIFFDVDGVLISTIASFHATDIAVAEYVTGTIHGLDWGQHEGKRLLTRQDVDAFKQAGGYNNDWDMCYLLSALSTARYREWIGTSLAERSTREWADISRAANLAGNGGRAWVDVAFPASARMDYGVIGDLYHEYYWGAAEIRKRFGREPRYLPEAEGLVHLEEMLYSPGFPAQLRAAGIRHLGMITGRVGPEVDSALERMIPALNPIPRPSVWPSIPLALVAASISAILPTITISFAITWRRKRPTSQLSSQPCLSARKKSRSIKRVAQI